MPANSAALVIGAAKHGQQHHVQHDHHGHGHHVVKGGGPHADEGALLGVVGHDGGDGLGGHVIILYACNGFVGMSIYSLINLASYSASIGYGIATAALGIILTCTRILDAKMPDYRCRQTWAAAPCSALSS